MGMRSLLLAPLLALGLFGVACGAPSTVEGVVSGGEFRIRDERPELNPGHERVTVVLAEEAGDALRVVTLSLPHVEALPLEVPLAVGGPEGVGVRAAYGELVEMVRSDGVRVLNTLSPVIVEAVEGEVVIETIEPLLAGSFEVVLEDGGRLVGDFVVPAR